MPDSIFLNYCYFIRFEVLNCYALDKKVLPIFIGRGAKVKKENLPDCVIQAGYTTLLSW